jgi:hypothetical protein
MDAKTLERWAIILTALVFVALIVARVLGLE